MTISASQGVQGSLPDQIELAIGQGERASSTLNNAALAEQCLQQLYAYRCGEPYDESSGLELFRRAADAMGLPAVRPHELRHTGATLAAATGATTKELMRRLGQSSPAAALLYQHAADDRDADIARALDATLSAATGSLNGVSDAETPELPRE